MRPTYKNIDSVNIPDYRYSSILGKVDMYAIYASHPEVIQMDLIFDAGRWSESGKQLAAATSALLKEGTSKYSAFEIAQKIESYGATIRSRAGMDTATISLFCLKKYGEILIRFLFEILESSSFSDEELNLYKNRNKEGLRIDLANSDIVCHREYTAMLFGDDHPYGYNKTNAHIDALNREQLANYYNTYRHKLRYVFIAGQCDESLCRLIEHACKKYIREDPTGAIINHDLQPSAERTKKMNLHKGIQASLKMGKIVEAKSLRDKHAQSIVNTILGGYFGSRLMKSIREQKGYTYNIYSHIDRMKHHASIGIHTEVGIEFIADTKSEIKNQINILQNDLISEKELGLVKNYLMGSLLMQFDGISKSINTLKQIILLGGKIENVNTFIDYLKNIEAEEIKLEAQSLLDFSSFHAISVR